MKAPMRRGVGGLMQCVQGVQRVGEKAMRRPERLFLLYNLRSAKGEPDAKKGVSETCCSLQKFRGAVNFFKLLRVFGSFSNGSCPGELFQPNNSNKKPPVHRYRKAVYREL
jgi:hypothetical protein